MNTSQTLATLTKMEPALWLLLLVVLHLGNKLVEARQVRAAQETPPSYSSFKLFALSKAFASISYALLYSQMLPIHLARKSLDEVYAGLYWTVYVVSAICVFYAMSAVLRKALSPLPGLSTAALVVFRWAAILALAIALTAHLPVFGVRDVGRWLNEMSVSFLLCICMFELSILVLFLTQLRRLGMFLLSRPIGFALGLALLGILDVALAVTFNAPPQLAIWVNIAEEFAIAFVVAMWSVYVLRPEPKRLPHTLSPASRLSKWDEIAKKIGVAQRETEHIPFITTVESVVDSILERHKGKA